MKDKDRYWDCLDQAMEASHGGRTDEALAWLDEALKAQPDGAEAHNGRGEILWDAGRVEEALHEFDLAALADPKFIAAHLNRAELLIEEFGEHEQALLRCDALLEGSPDLPQLDRMLEAEVYYLKSKAFFYLDNLPGALFLVRRALRSAGDVGIYRAFEGQILFETSQLEAAKQCLERAIALDPDSGHALYHLGLVLERMNFEEAAEDAFARADALDPDHYPRPLAIDAQRFGEIVERALHNLPRSIREFLGDVEVGVQDFPSQELIDRESVSPQLLGIYEGPPADEPEPRAKTGLLFGRKMLRGSGRLTLFKKNLEKVCRTEADLAAQIQLTIKHEVGHYLGLDAEDLERLGLV